MMAFSRTSAVQPRVLDLNERLREISKLLRPVLGDDIEILMVPRSPSAVVEVEALADHESRRREDLVEWHGWHAFRRGLRSNVNDLGALDLTIQKILRQQCDNHAEELRLSPGASGDGCDGTARCRNRSGESQSRSRTVGSESNSRNGQLTLVSEAISLIIHQ